jgi:hypothetical protein
MAWKCDSCGSANPDESAIRCTCGYERQEIEISSKNSSVKRPLFWLGEILTICGALYCMMGMPWLHHFP